MEKWTIFTYDDFIYFFFYLLLDRIDEVNFICEKLSLNVIFNL